MRNLENQVAMTYDETLQYVNVVDEKVKLNRFIVPAHVQQIKKKMEVPGNLDYFGAIIINTVTHNILDGQHRWEAFKKCIEDGTLNRETDEIKVMFVNVPVDKEMEKIVEYNSTSKNWALDDYIETYIKQGRESYIKLQSFAKTHSMLQKGNKLEYRYAYAMIKGESGQTKMKQGNIQISYEDLVKAEEVHNEINYILEHLDFQKQDPSIEGLSIVWHEYRSKHAFAIWKKAFKANKTHIQKKHGLKGFKWNEIIKELNSDCYDIEKKVI